MNSAEFDREYDLETAAYSCIECNQSDSDEGFYETHQWLPDRLWCINKKGSK
jgi:hypothetical protein